MSDYLPSNNVQMSSIQAVGSLTGEQMRSIQEIQASLIIAQKMPRNEINAMQRIEQSCKRKKLAEVAMYAYPRGGKTVTGVSIRLAEMLLQNWGNCRAGIEELHRENGVSFMRSYAWDLETNTMIEKKFQIKHERDTRNGQVQLTSERDIYELTANQGSRRLRACILSIIPKDIQELALEEVHKTLAGNSEEPLKDRAFKVANAFSKLGVSKEMIEEKFNNKLETISEDELIELRSIYNSMKDGMTKRADWFESAKKEEKQEDIKAKVSKLDLD